MSRKLQQKETQMPPTSMETLEEINARADRTIAELDRKEISLNQQIQAAQAELAAIPTDRQERTITLQTRRRDVVRLNDEHDQAISYARLSHGTDREGFTIRAVAEAKKSLDAAQALLKDVESQTAQAEASATARERELKTSLQRWQAELEMVRRECAATEVAREKAHNELGRKKTDEYKRIFKEKYRDPIADLERRRIALQVEKQQFLEKAQEDLLSHDWYSFYDELVDIEHDAG